jgi:hypothetical protein
MNTTINYSTGGDSLPLTTDDYDTLTTMNATSVLLAELGEIHAAWSDRLNALRAESLQWANDVLYTHIQTTVSKTSGTIRDAFVSASHTAERTADMVVPIFTYNTVVYHLGERPADQDSVFPPPYGNIIRTNGWEHTVEDICESVSVHEVFQTTDLLLRIGALFGSNFEITTAMSPIAGATQAHYTPMQCFVLATFRPEGVYPGLLREIISVADRYSEHVCFTGGAIVTKPEEEGEAAERYHKGHD